MSKLAYRGRCAGCGVPCHNSKFRNRHGHFKYHAIPDNTSLPCPHQTVDSHRICRPCYNLHLDYSSGRKAPIAAATTDAAVVTAAATVLVTAAAAALTTASHTPPPTAATTQSPPPDPAVPVDSDFFTANRTRSDVTDRLLLRPSCASYLAAVVKAVASVVELHLAPGSLHRTRLFHSDCTSTVDHWAAMLREDNRVRVERYADVASASDARADGLTVAQLVFKRSAGGSAHVYLDHPTFPTGLAERGLAGWQKAVKRERWVRDVQDRTRTAAALKSKLPKGGRADKRRGRWQVRVKHDHPILGLSTAVQEEKCSDNFYTHMPLPPELRDNIDYLCHDCPTMYNIGPCNTCTHHDGVGGWSQLVEGWKVFMWWDAEQSSLLSYDTDTNKISVEAEATAAGSFHWSLLGPGCSISLPADLPHCVVTLTSSLLLTYTSDNGPSRLCRLLGFILAGKIHDPMWLHDWQHDAVSKGGTGEQWLPSHFYVELLQCIFRHTAAKVADWQQSGELTKVQHTADAWQEARQRGMDVAFAGQHEPRRNNDLTEEDSATILEMYEEMCACMQRWRCERDERVDVARFMPRVSTWRRDTVEQAKANGALPDRLTKPCTTVSQSAGGKRRKITVC